MLLVRDYHSLSSLAWHHPFGVFAGLDGAEADRSRRLPQLGDAPLGRLCCTCRSRFQRSGVFLAFRTLTTWNHCIQRALPVTRIGNSKRFCPIRIGEAIRRAWHLTPAKARSASALALGRNPRQIAVVHAVSIHTVRTQLKRAMSKAGVHSQSALVASVYSIVGGKVGVTQFGRRRGVPVLTLEAKIDARERRGTKLGGAAGSR